MPDEILGLDFEKPVVELEKKILELNRLGKEESIDFSQEISNLQKKCDKLKKEIYTNLTAWEKVLLARHPQRPYTIDYVKLLMEDYIELHGDRKFADDLSIVGFICKFNHQPVIAIGHQKGRTTQENLERNFGMPHPEGYRKALRLMNLAERFQMPVIFFIDTPCAYPGIGAEERGQAEAIATNLKNLAILSVPIIIVVIGEGGSGGALGIGVGDRILMLENAVYFVCSPEACSSILFRDATKAPHAAEALKLTATDLLKLGIIDEIVPEPLGGAHRDMDFMGKELTSRIKKNLCQLKKLSKTALLEERYKRFRRMGEFLEQKGTRPSKGRESKESRAKSSKITGTKPK